MNTFDYAGPLATANRLIARFGQLGAVRRAGAADGPSYDPTPGADVDHAARFVIIAYDAREIDGSRIQASDMKALVAPGTLPFTPTTSDRLVEADETSWQVVDVETLRPAETTLLYTFQVRK